MKTLRNSTIDALSQVEQLVLSFDDSNVSELYNVPPAHVMSGVGKHVRHILDHFLAFQQGIISGCIDYNVRHRDGRLEDDPQLALLLLKDISNWLETSDFSDRNIEVESEVSVTKNVNQLFRSSLSRELCYLINHTIHHVAYAKLLTAQHGLALDHSIGIAPSTATYLRGQNA